MSLGASIAVEFEIVLYATWMNGSSSTDVSSDAIAFVLWLFMFIRVKSPL